MGCDRVHQEPERLIAGEASQQLLLAVVEEARSGQLLSEEHFTVDGTLIHTEGGVTLSHDGALNVTTIVCDPVRASDGFRVKLDAAPSPVDVLQVTAAEPSR